VQGFVLNPGLDVFGFVSQQRGFSGALQFFDSTLLDGTGETCPVDMIVGILSA